MNITGPAVAAALRATVKSPSHMVVIHDSLEHQPFKLHFKEKGSAAGHNGIKSVIASLGGDTNFPRFRIGIGRGGAGEDTARYVLGPLSGAEKQFWSERGDGLSLVLNEIERVLKKNVSSA
jgi:peptidyl-tRNA hydrolase, PTH1 family